jgi:hypothetical protein
MEQVERPASMQADRSSSACPDITAGRPLFMNALDRPRLQGMINDLLGRIGSVRQGFAASPDLFSYLPAKSTFINDARYPEI